MENCIARFNARRGPVVVADVLEYGTAPEWQGGGRTMTFIATDRKTYIAHMGKVELVEARRLSIQSA